ncbi:hypothetical protein Lser_V15G41391 [Lactuca serriola]
MSLNMSMSVIHAKGREIFHPEMRCPKIAFTFVRYLIYGGIDIMGPFSMSKGNKYILVAVDYVSKWAEAQALPSNDARVVVHFLKKLFSRFGVPKALISYRGTHFANDQLAKVLQKYGVHHRFSTIASTNKWANRSYKSGIKTYIGAIGWRLVYGNNCHLPVEIEYKAFWALKIRNFELNELRANRLMQMNALEEHRNEAYTSSLIYMDKTKKWNDMRLKGHKDFQEGKKVPLFNSRLKLFLGNLQTRWDRPFVVKQVFPHRAIELISRDGIPFKVNGHRVKHYEEGMPIEEKEGEILTFTLAETT